MSTHHKHKHKHKHKRTHHTTHNTPQQTRCPVRFQLSLKNWGRLKPVTAPGRFAASVRWRCRYGKSAQLTRNLGRVTVSEHWVRKSQSQDLSCSGSSLKFRCVACIRVAWLFNWRKIRHLHMLLTQCDSYPLFLTTPGSLGFYHITGHPLWTISLASGCPPAIRSWWSAGVRWCRLEQFTNTLTSLYRLRPHSTRVHAQSHPHNGGHGLRVEFFKPPCTHTARGNHTQTSTTHKPRTKGQSWHGDVRPVLCRPPLVASGRVGGPVGSGGEKTMCFSRFWEAGDVASH